MRVSTTSIADWSIPVLSKIVAHGGPNIEYRLGLASSLRGLGYRLPTASVVKSRSCSFCFTRPTTLQNKDFKSACNGTRTPNLQPRRRTPYPLELDQKVERGFLVRDSPSPPTDRLNSAKRRRCTHDRMMTTIRSSVAWASPGRALAFPGMSF